MQLEVSMTAFILAALIFRLALGTTKGLFFANFAKLPCHLYKLVVGDPQFQYKLSGSFCPSSKSLIAFSLNSLLNRSRLRSGFCLPLLFSI
ncbi:hypothetical protein SAMN05216316_1258 [Nitrosovibrio sp. Nv6]|nr:hypothetical protein SAMN05216316_1258 [Nitrosovibrio sp. Nv6]